MKYVQLASFKADFKRLATHERALFVEAARQMNAAYAQHSAQSIPRWPAALRVKPVAGAPGIWEMTWSFAGPDGRATFEIVEIDGEPAIRWRRIGDHKIFEQR